MRWSSFSKAGLNSRGNWKIPSFPFGKLLKVTSVAWFRIIVVWPYHHIFPHFCWACISLSPTAFLPIITVSKNKSFFRHECNTLKKYMPRLRQKPQKCVFFAKNIFDSNMDVDYEICDVRAQEFCLKCKRAVKISPRFWDQVHFSVSFANFNLEDLAWISSTWLNK